MKILSHRTRPGTTMARCGLQLAAPAVGVRTGVIDLETLPIRKEYNIVSPTTDTNPLCPDCQWVAEIASPPRLLRSAVAV